MLAQDEDTRPVRCDLDDAVQRHGDYRGEEGNQRTEQQDATAHPDDGGYDCSRSRDRDALVDLALCPVFRSVVTKCKVGFGPTDTVAAQGADMAHQTLGLYESVVDEDALTRTVDRFRSLNIKLPTFAELSDPSTIPGSIHDRLADIGPDEPHPLNLFRVHWYNDASRTGRSEQPGFIELPTELTGVDARIILAIGDRFPMITAHKVLAAYSCLAPRIVAGAFDPTQHRAIWPSTGNYARGGVAISRIMNCRGVAVLPEGMSQERFDWLDEWIGSPNDVIRTYGVESNVKEIYDECKRLAQDPENVILNQFSEYSNHLGHYGVTGRALHHIFELSGGKQLAAYVSASGSAGTLGAGDYLKEQTGCAIVPVEALECPTMLYNGFGDHNIQGIGDKHIPLIHNVTNSDDIVGISDRATDALFMVFNTDAGRTLLASKAVDADVIDQLTHMGLSSICNMLASIKYAQHHRLTSDDVIVTVATDGAAMYMSEIDKFVARDYPNGFGDSEAAAAFGEHLAGESSAHLMELGQVETDRVFNLGYFTWVEQQGIDFEHFEERRSQDFWDGTRHYLSKWDEMIADFNDRTGVVV